MRIPIVDEEDNILYYKDDKDRDAHKEVTRISGLWVSAPNGDVLLAQRGLNKKSGPGLWGPAAAGSVEEGETYESNIIKEAEEEIGLKDLKPTLGPKLRRSTSHEYFAQWFSVVVDRNYPFIKQDNEVESIKWFTRDELVKLLNEKPEMFIKNFKERSEYFLNENHKTKK